MNWIQVPYLRDSVIIEKAQICNFRLPGPYADFIALKKQNSNVKLLVSMGGWSQGSSVYSNVSSKQDLLQNILLTKFF